jgi:phage terminase large subunit-like protein
LKFDQWLLINLQGLRPKVSTIDEWLSGDLREDVVGAIEQGASKHEDWLIIAISSEGTVRNGSGDTVKMELTSILRGEYVAPHISIWHYKLDEVGEVANPALWVKAQPNLGLTVSYETYQLDVERAEKAPASRNDILAKRFGIPMEGYTYFFTYEETLPHRPAKASGVCLLLWEQTCRKAMTSVRLHCCSTLRKGFGIKTRSYIT